MGPSNPDSNNRPPQKMQLQIEKYQENVAEEVVYVGERLLSGSLSFYISLTIGQVSKQRKGKQNVYEMYFIALLLAYDLHRSKLYIYVNGLQPINYT